MSNDSILVVIGHSEDELLLTDFQNRDGTVILEKIQDGLYLGLIQLKQILILGIWEYDNIERRRRIRPKHAPIKFAITLARWSTGP